MRRACGCASASATAGSRRILDVAFPNGSSDVDLVASDDPLDPARVLAAMVFVRDRRGDFVVVHSVRRGEWGSPGGWREDDETPVENAVRETLEETGLRLRHPDVLPCGYERFTPRTDDNLFTRDKPFLQVFRTRLDDVRPELTDGDDGIHETRWVTPQEYAELVRPPLLVAPRRRGLPGPARSRPPPLRRTYAAHRVDGIRGLSWWVRLAQANPALSAGW